VTDVQTVVAAVDQVQGPARIIEASIPEFAKVLPAQVGPEKFARWSLSVIRKGLGGGTTDMAQKQREAWQKVLACETGRLSLMSALMDCASLGLEPGRTFHLVPFGSEVTGITDYKGEIQLIWNAVQRPVIASLVYSKDEFAMTGANIPPAHNGDWFAEDGRGNITGGYAYVDYGLQLYSQVIRMPEAEFLKHRAKAKTKTVWDEWPESMRLKTLVHQLRKWVPWSAEIRQP
jgi:recombination protein RecT